ncbi:4-alpha-glucanotransferase DPE1, chloroplastic/amyloplastic [Phragmites australis]|uniref:4-alpha-glucanotransferase DPE1, chloroplastic/amyloplastic n=1 Tax=Phragmites australis TaxID=29695 RepID=UPI002D76F24C|nr:4-alpha-glucanotransferase DPE1, chloroplastic/amyloplastic [Phragmites australis]
MRVPRVIPHRPYLALFFFPSPLRSATLACPLVEMILARSLTLPLPTPSSSPRRSFLLPPRPARGLPVRVAACRATNAMAVALDPAVAAAVGVGEELPEGYDQMTPSVEPARRRRAGVLLHPTSLRGPHGIGDLGDEALAFLHWLRDAGCTLWQVLPLVPPGRKSGEDGSPYSGQDANCGNTLLISLEELVKDGLLMEDELPDSIDMEYVEFDAIANMKEPLIAKAAERLLLSHGELKTQYDCFKKNPNISGWLEDAALFAAIDKSIDALSWYEWPEPLKNRHLGALEDIYQKQKDFIEIFMAQQFLFQRQWQRIRKYAQKLGISIMGDMPIYVGYHSADVWANRKSFLLDKNGFPTFVSGVPPDAFSETGQLWNSPLYDWKAMEAGGFKWWIKRIRRALDLYDEFRIDHFRGLAGFWAVHSDSKVALVGSWRAGPRNAFFDALFKAVGRINIIAEDLGVITEDVVELRKSIGAPGMAVLQFAFGGGSDNPHLPHNHELDQVVYTGTHDNDTVLGWWQKLPEEEKQIVLKYLPEAENTDISWTLITAALSSVARTSMVTMQDILGLDSSARMNTPATQKGNWKWRIPSSVGFDSLSPEAAKLKEILALYNRL